MRLVIEPDKKTASICAAKLIANAIKKKPNLVLGLATGSTPLDTYRELIQIHKEQGVSFKQVRTFNLDEYYGLKHDDVRSYHYFMNKNFFDFLDIPKENINIPDGALPMDKIRQYCREYEKKIRAYGGIDIQLLGIGMDGHIGFNEPGSSLASRTRLKTLSWPTKVQNSQDFGEPDKVPDLAITMGIGTIMECKTVLLLAFGKSKAHIIRDSLEGPITSLVPGSILQMHPKLKVIVDEEAALGLRLYPYYKYMEVVREKYDFPEITEVDREDMGQKE